MDCRLRIFCSFFPHFLYSFDSLLVGVGAGSTYRHPKKPLRETAPPKMLLRSTVALLLHATVSSAALIIRLPNLLPPLGHVSGNHSDSIFARQKNGDDVSTCGYLNGDPSKPRTANAGYNCRVDTQNGLWGFCPTSVIAASDCGLAGSCVDDFKCSKGCGFVDKTQLTTITW